MTLLVHLDHLIPKDDVYYTSPQSKRIDQRKTEPDKIITYQEIRDRRGIFENLRKPDFQRQTNAWTPEKCVEFLDSVIRRWLIPHIIMWKKPNSRIKYVLDGAHRISVARAWMENDWGDSPEARDYYAGQDLEKIIEAADVVRALAKKEIGEFKQFQEKKLKKLEQLNDLQREVLASRERDLLEFFESLDSIGLRVDWADDNSYEEVAQSFVRINKGGQALDEFEVDLIVNRNSSFVRTIMAIAGAGKGNYWPPFQQLPTGLERDLNSFPKIVNGNDKIPTNGEIKIPSLVK